MECEANGSNTIEWEEIGCINFVSLVKNADSSYTIVRQQTTYNLFSYHIRLETMPYGGRLAQER